MALDVIIQDGMIDTFIEFKFMSGEEVIEVEGKITAVLPSTMFRAELENGHQVLAHISGKLRKHFIKITVGDIVKMMKTLFKAIQ